MLADTATLALSMSERNFPSVMDSISKALNEGVAPGIAAGVWDARWPEIVFVAAGGNRKTHPVLEPLHLQTVFDLASVTKVTATTALAGVLVDRGWLRWEDPVSIFLPDFPHKQILIRHLLAHTAGYESWKPFWENIRARFKGRELHWVDVAERQKAMLEELYLVAPSLPVDQKAVYSDISFLLLGFALEATTGRPLDRAVQEFVWDPWNLPGFHFHRTVMSPDHVPWGAEYAATLDCPWRKAVLEGQVHDDNCWAMGGYGGHAGAFGSVMDVLLFVRRLMDGVLSRETLEKIWTRVPVPPGCERTLGWDTPSGENPAAGPAFSTKSVGHNGFTGTSLWIDLKAKVAAVLLTNRIHPHVDNISIRTFRPKFHTAVMQDLQRLHFVMRPS